MSLVVTGPSTVVLVSRRPTDLAAGFRVSPVLADARPWSR